MPEEKDINYANKNPVILLADTDSMPSEIVQPLNSMDS